MNHRLPLITFRFAKHERFIMTLQSHPVKSCTGTILNSVEFVRDHHPARSRDNWSHYCDEEINGTPFTFYVFLRRNNAWVNVKVSVDEEDDFRKQNFWLLYNGERFGRGRDFFIAEKYHQHLLEWVKENYLDLCSVCDGRTLIQI